MAVIRIDAISKRFGATVAVDDVTLDVAPNEFLALLGASGCGKTTLLRIIAGFEQADGGRVFIDGADATATPPYGRPVNMMFQSYALFPHMTVEDNVAFGLKQDGLAGAELAGRVKEALDIVELGALAARKPDQLSGGQRQRVALARCLAKRPKVLLLDEPMAALDKHLRERTQLELMALRERLGITFIMVTHDQSEAMAMADRVAVMDHGRILQIARPRDLYERPANARVARFFGDINLWEAQPARPGTVTVPALGLEVSGEGAAVALRPERVRIVTLPEATLTGVVQDAVYLGTVSTYFVKVPTGGVVRVLTQNGEDAPVLHKGDAAHLTWSASAMTVLPP
jgi:putrescine transport system ATP-binding protein